MPNASKKFAVTRFLKKVKETIAAHAMLAPGDAVLIGVSGGPDSMALLHGLRAVSDDYRLHLGIAHLNHGLRRKDADKDEKFVVSAAKKLNLPCYVKKRNVAAERRKTGGSLEEAARIARYDFLFETAEAEGFDRIAVGHQQDDNAELILLYLLRGSGPAGLSGTPPVRDKIIRPLIRTSRAEILDFLKSHTIGYVIDRSNADQRFTRNRIRHQLLPLLKKEYNPKASESLNRLGMILRSEEEWIDGYVRQMTNQITLTAKPGRLALSVNALAHLHPALQRRVIRRAILGVKGDLRRITCAHTASVIGLAENPLPGSRLDLPDRIRVLRQTDRILISREKQSLRSPALAGKPFGPPDFTYVVSASDIPAKPGPGRPALHIQETGARLTLERMDRSLVNDLKGSQNRIAYLDWDRIRFPLIIRNPRAGDRFTPLGMAGSQMLKKFLTGSKIDPMRRAVTPVLADPNGIIWVCGLRIAARVRVTEATATVLKAEFINR